MDEVLKLEPAMTRLEFKLLISYCMCPGKEVTLSYKLNIVLYLNKVLLAMMYFKLALHACMFQNSALVFTMLVLEVVAYKL